MIHCNPGHRLAQSSYLAIPKTRQPQARAQRARPEPRASVTSNYKQYFVHHGNSGTISSHVRGFIFALGKTALFPHHTHSGAAWDDITVRNPRRYQPWSLRNWLSKQVSPLPGRTMRPTQAWGSLLTIVHPCSHEAVLDANCAHPGRRRLWRPLPRSGHSPARTAAACQVP